MSNGKLWPALVLAACLACCSGCGQPGTAQNLRTVGMSRTVRIPVVASTPNGASEAGADKLLVTEGGPDELPEGPDGFAVLDDGGFAITDPLRKRIALFNSEGSYRAEWPVGFAADSIATAEGGLLIRNAADGSVHAFDRNGKPVEGLRASSPRNAQARLTEPGAGVIERAEADGGALQVRLEKPGLRLLSIQTLARDSGGNTYVALEATRGGDAVDVSKFVRKYTAQGAAAVEVSGIPLDYYVQPNDELRVIKGVLYQLMPMKTEVRINIWKLNQ